VPLVLRLPVLSAKLARLRGGFASRARSFPQSALVMPPKQDQQVPCHKPDAGPQSAAAKTHDNVLVCMGSMLWTDVTPGLVRILQPLESPNPEPSDLSLGRSEWTRTENERFARNRYPTAATLPRFGSPHKSAILAASVR